MPERRRELRRAKRKPTRQAAWIRNDGGADVPCVLWDLSESGARISAARANNLPRMFTLVLTKDRSMLHHCRVVWRKDGQIGVQFVRAVEMEEHADLRALWSLQIAGAATHAAAAAAPGGPFGIEMARHELASAMPGLAIASGQDPRGQDTRRGLGGGGWRGLPLSLPPSLPLSSLAAMLLALFVAATALLYAAGQLGDAAPWALKVCDNAGSFCDHPSTAPPRG